MTNSTLEMTRTDGAEQIAGRVIITWPKTNGEIALNNLTTVQDAETGDQMTGIIALRLNLGSDDGFEPGILTVELTEVLDTDGKPGRGAGWQPGPTPEYTAHCERMRELRGGRSILDLTDAEFDRLDALDKTFAGKGYGTATNVYLVAEMRIAD